MNECIINFSLFNWWAIIVSTLAAYLIGALWFSNATFGKAWSNILGYTEDQLKKGWLTALLVTFVTTFFTAVVLEILIIGLEIKSILNVILLGILIGFFVVAGNMLSENLYSKRPLKFWFITAGYRFLIILVMAVILGLWP